MSKKILYLHGFASSPASWKVQLLASALAQRGLGERLHCPALSPVPVEAIAQAEAIINQQGRELTLIGSSLGGFMATRVAERYGCRAALINPAVRPHELLCDYLGPQTNPYTNECFELLPVHMDELKALAVPVTAPERLWILQQQEDEVLDYRKALTEYQFARLSLECGGNHAFTGFERYPAQIIHFLGL